MSAEPGLLRALLRLFVVQGSWNYERMLGIGMGYAAAPLLDDLARADATRYRDATARSAEYFNCNPNLAGLALGALARAERDGVPGSQIARLRTALCSPLGALGDQLFWAGLVPALAGAAIIAVVLGARWWAVIGLLGVYNTARIWTARWALRTGLANGTGVGAAVAGSWLPRAIARIGPVAGFTVGAAIPPVADWYLRGVGRGPAVATLLLAAVGVLLSRWFEGRVTAVRFALVAIALTALVRWVLA